MTPESREAAKQHFKNKNLRRKEARKASPNVARRIEARAFRRSLGGAFGREKFSKESGMDDLVRYGTMAK